MNPGSAQCFTLALSLVLLLNPISQAQETTTRHSNLTGVVTDHQGTAISGAQVFVYTAKPREGTSTVCPYCYSDCSKSSTTNQEGFFTLPDLDASLQFRLLTVADGFKPRYNQFIIVETGLVSIKLTQRNDTFIPKHRKTIGRITNYDGESIVGARVGVDSVQIEKLTQRSIPEGMDPMAISDANGVFILTSETPFTTLDLAISAREYAPLKMTGIEPGKHWIIQMTEGVTIRGRVLKNNKPVSGTTMVLDGIYRSDDFYARHSELATNAEGYFEFLNMPPLTDYYLRGKMDDFSPHGALGPLWVTTKGDGTLVDVGNLQITPDLRIAGRLILDSKAALPPDTKIVITTERGWDRSETIVAENGQFELAGLPLDRYRISVQIPNHRLAIENPNLNLFNGSHLEGTLNTNLENLTILVEAGPQHTRGNLRKTQRLLNRSRGGPFRNPIEIPSRFRFPEN